jgi:hypothetical protein
MKMARRSSSGSLEKTSIVDSVGMIETLAIEADPSIVSLTLDISTRESEEVKPLNGKGEAMQKWCRRYLLHGCMYRSHDVLRVVAKPTSESNSS